MKKIGKIALVALTAFTIVLASCENSGNSDKTCNHTWENAVCTICGMGAGVIDATAMSAEGLGIAVRESFALGATQLIITLPEEPGDDRYKAIRRALIETESVEDGSINLTLKGAKSIGNDAFAYHADGNNEYVKELKSVTLADATTIKKYAFYFCPNLESVYAPNVTEIEFCVFTVCKKLKDIYLPNAKSIGHSTFDGCGALEEITLPELVRLEEAQFMNCESLRVVNLPKVTSILEMALSQCHSLEKITFGTPIMRCSDPFVFHGSSEMENEFLVEVLRRIDLVLSSEQTEMVKIREADERNPAEWEGSHEPFRFGSSRTFIGYEFNSITIAE